MKLQGTILLFAGLLLSGNLSRLHAEPISLAVMNFANTERRTETQWLSKGLADMMIRELSQVESVIILEREKMQRFYEEIGLSEFALFNQEKAPQMGSVAKVKQVLYGSYAVQGSKINISIFTLDMDSQKILQSGEATGDLDQLEKHIQTLTLDFLKKHKIQTKSYEIKNIKFMMSNSIAAVEHFYNAIDQVDQGNYPQAFGNFFAASQKDPNFLETKLWIGRMFAAMRHYEQAVLSFKNLHHKHAGKIEGVDALMLAARIEESHLQHPEQAISIYDEIIRSKSKTPHAIIAAYHAGQLYQQKGETLKAYEHYKVVNVFKEKVERGLNKLTLYQHRQSQFFKWQQALELYRDSSAQMVFLYRDLTGQMPKKDWPSVPRGVFVVDPEHPVIFEKFLGQTKSMFHQRQYYGDSKDDFYAVILPAGFVATGVEISLSGTLHKSKPWHSYALRVMHYPLPRDNAGTRLGVLFGQTVKKSTLRKNIAFHGDHKKIFSLHFYESASTIHDWGIKVRVKRESEEKELSPLKKPLENPKFWEGMPVAKIPLSSKGFTGLARSQYDRFFMPLKEMALLSDPGVKNYLVWSEGELDGEQTDLWISTSSNLKKWSKPSLLTINSASHDYNPRLVRAEDGRVFLFWISKRRGKNWELWNSYFKPKSGWSSPQRIPFEEFTKLFEFDQKEVQASEGIKEQVKKLISKARNGDNKKIKKSKSTGWNSAQELLDYDILQDHKGRWILCVGGQHELVLLQSNDAKIWSLLSKIPISERHYGLSLTQSETAKYRLGGLSENGMISIFNSNDAKTWGQGPMSAASKQKAYVRYPLTHRLKISPHKGEELDLLVSDPIYGLRYSRFLPDSHSPQIDLVTRAGLESFAATKFDGQFYLVAFKQSEEIILQKYRDFNIRGSEIKEDKPNWQIFSESEKDQQGNPWHRIFAQERHRVSDVTSVGLEPSGRVWWGIETGIMYKRGTEFFAQDVSQGFFNHNVSDIESCVGERTWFTSKHLTQPLVGYVEKDLTGHSNPQFQTMTVPKVQGSITAIQCDQSSDQLLVGTSQGDVIGLAKEGINFHYKLASNPSVTALALDPKDETLWIGTKEKGLYRTKRKKESDVLKSPWRTLGEVTALTIDAEGSLWAAARGRGLMKFKNDQWKNYSPKNSEVAYSYIGALKPSPLRGVWYLPHDEIRSYGLGYFDGKNNTLYNPPHDVMDRPSSLEVGKNGDIWIGTWNKGLYLLAQRNKN